MISKKKLIAGGAAIAAVGILAGVAIAQHGPGGGHGRMGGMGHGMMMGEGHGQMGMGRGMMMGQGQGHGQGHGGGQMGRGPGRMGGMGGMADPASHLATLKTEIGIKSEQQADWDAYAKVVTEAAKDGETRRTKVDRDAVAKMTQTEREAFRKSMQDQAQRQRDGVKAAAETLLAKLDDAQKAKARDRLPGLVAHGPGSGGGRHGMMGGGMGGGRGMGHHGNR